MKTLKTVLSALAILFISNLLTNNVFAKSGDKPSPKVIGVINRANWCAICKANGQRVMSIMPTYTNKAIVFVPNDLTDAMTKAASAKELAKLGVAKTLSPVNATGVIVLVDARTHKLLKTVSIAEYNEQIEAEINSALALK
ncbi:hypothetical protein IC235_02905 [Hymenobacter sp. BT664]|uniref:Thioredoxin domain-containing protein n=1 Tax=Hymenobacter montanus TaxID=2771359 RepID=A0A927GI80_9BACT|nr:hypothetical protein [Hymenobacter montanus]MBD2766839.1 hypothetical protein [Hymenobacter montanus]